jgi:hypothetical protein
MTDLQSLCDAFDHGPGTLLDRVAALATRYPAELAKIRRRTYKALGKQSRLFPVALNGSTRRGFDQGYFMTPLRDGTFGYLQRRSDDCLQAAIASLLQMAPHQIPDLQMNRTMLRVQDIDEVFALSGEKMHHWTQENGVTLRYHARPLPSAKRWIGVVDVENSLHHCLLMAGPDFLFDPASPRTPPDPEHALYSPDDIDYSITIETS